MDMEDTLRGENLAFYKNIQDLKVLTAKARALITRSHAMFNDIIQGDEFNRRLRANEQEEDFLSLKSLHGECPKCGLEHGAHDFCIVQEIIAVEKEHRESARKSATTLTSHYSVYKEDAEEYNEASYSQPTVSPPTPREKPPREKAKEWENLLYREMTPKELDVEYSKICYRYGVANGRKFLLARSLAQDPDAVQPLFTEENCCIAHRNKYQESKSKLASITRECFTQKKLGFPQPCAEFTPGVRNKMANVLNLELPCEIKTPKQEKVWKNALKAKPKKETVIIDHRETIEDDYSFSSISADKSSTSRSEWCTCGLEGCDCGIQPNCNPPGKKCIILSDYHNNYLFTIREKLRKRGLLNGKIPLSEYHHNAQSSSKEVPFDVVKKDAELMMRKAHALYKKDLKNCIVSVIGRDDVNLDKNVSKIAEITSAFTKPDDKAWDQWIERFQAQEKIEDDEDISEDSDISTTRSNSITSSSTTDREFQNPQPFVRHMPFVEEPLKLVDILFDKIYARFRKSVQKNTAPGVSFPYKPVFFSHVDKLISLKCTDSIGGEVVDKLCLHFHNLKSLKPKHLLKAQRLKRLKAKNKQLSRKTRRRNYVEGIQLGKRYRRSKKSMIFTKVRGYIGFNAKKRSLLKKPTPERFATCDLVGDESGVLLSKKRIHYHYRLLRTLFNGPMDSDDKESLMDEGMRERLQTFKKTLHNSSQSRFGTESDTEDEGASMLKAASVPIRRPSKRDEKKLKSAPGYFLNGTRSDQNSHTLSSRLNDYGTELSMFEETYPRTIKTSSCKTASKQITSRSLANHRGVRSRAVTSNGSSCNSPNRWGDYRNAPSLLRESSPKTSTNSSRRLSSNQIAHLMRCDQTEEPRKTFRKKSDVSTYSSNSHSFTQREPFCLPTPPLSDSSCDEIDFHSIQHRFPPKEESHMEKSARLDARTRQKHIKENNSNPQLRNCGKQNLQELEESELTDTSSDSYAPKLLKIPPKRTLTSPRSLITYAHDQRGIINQKTIKGRAKSPHLSDHSSTDTELVNPLCNIHRERPAWDHKSGLNRKIAPYLETQTHVKAQDNVPPSGRLASYETRRMRNLKNTFTSPLPKAGPSILKNSSLPKPPSDGTSENQSNPYVLGIRSVKRQTFSDSSYQTTSWPNEGLIKPARVVTERLLKATQGNPEVDLLTGSAKKHSVQSRATPDAIPSSSTNAIASKKISVGAKLGVTKSGQLESENDDSSPRRRLSVTIKTPKGASTSHHTGDTSPNETTVHAAESNPLQNTDMLTVSSSKRFSMKASSKTVSEVFRQRSLAPSEQGEKKEPHTKTKALKKGAAIETATPSSLQNVSNSSMATKLKKLEAIGPTKKRCFDMDIGQGINCVNYLKENAPGADEIKKKELVDLLVTPVEIKKAPKKAPAKVEKEISLDSTLVMSQQSAKESSSTSTSLISVNQSSKNTKIQDKTVHDVTPLRKTNFKTLDQIYKEVHGINKNNTPIKLVDHDYEYEAKKKQQLNKHKIFP